MACTLSFRSCGRYCRSLLLTTALLSSIVRSASVTIHSPSIEVFSGVYDLNWTVVTDDSGATVNDFMEVDLRAAGAEWVGLGIAPQGMQGVLLVCHCPTPSTASATPTCLLLQGDSSNSVNAITVNASARPTILSASTSSASFSLRVKLPPSTLGVVRGTRQRAVAAYGDWASFVQFPLQHPDGGTTSFKVDFYAGLVDRGANTFMWSAMAIGVGATILLTVLGSLLSTRDFTKKPRVAAGLFIGASVFFVGLVAMVITMSWHGYVEAGATAPVGRAFGDGATFLFFLLLWPTIKHFGPGKLLGLSYPSFLPAHVFAAWLLLISLSVHFGVMYDALGDAAAEKVFSWDPEDVIPVLPGFLAWLLLCIMVIFMLVGRATSFAVFRVSHSLFFLVLVFAGLHHWQLWVLIAPGFLAWVVDNTLRIHSASAASPVFQTATYHKAAGVLELRIRCKLSQQPGQYVFLSTTTVGGILHPFTVAAYAGGEAVFFIKVSDRPSSLTRRLAGAAESGSPPALGRILWSGPYVSLPSSSPVLRRPHLLLVAGGIGVTPCLGLLQYFSEVKERKLQPTQITLAWSVRTLSLAALLGDLLLAALHALNAGSIRAHAFIHVTSDSGPASLGSLGASPFVQICRGRPKLMEYLSSKSTPGTIGAFGCGPDAMMSELVEKVTECADAEVLLHREVFKLLP